MPKFDSFPKTDAHIHFNAGRDNILILAQEYGFDLLTINTEVPEFPSIDEQQKLAKKYQKTADVDLAYAATFSSKNIFREGWAKRTIEKIKREISGGACGVKFWKNIGMSIERPDGSFLMPDAPELKPVFDFLEEQTITVLGHQGEPRNCWLPADEMTVKSDREYFSSHPEYHMYKHDRYPGYWEHIKARDAILERHPNLRFVGLHLASLEWNLDEVADRLDTFQNLAVDLAERISHLYYHAAKDRNRVIDFFQTYQDRIIYGTDIIDDPDKSPSEINEDLKHRWESHWKFFTTDQLLTSPQIEYSFHGLALPETILKKIYRTNAGKWYGI